MIRMWGVVVLLAVTGLACDCGKKPAAPTLLKEGEPCENDDRCETGLCDGANGENTTCVRRCGDVCKTDEVCVQLTPNRFACQPDKRKLCAPCTTDSECPYPSDHCILVNNENVCGRDCAFDQNCPSGYRCVNAVGVDGQSKIQQCVPIVASCACLARGDFMQQCDVSNTLGTCFGVKECDLVLNEVVCSAQEPVAESCNGVDDDCDGTIDEGQMNDTCGVGECQRSMSSCVDGGTVVCTPGDPVAELCNGKDDDCDGTNDNGFDLTADTMNCGACGNVCSLPHATSTCTTSACRVVTCDTGWSNCNMMDPDGCESDVTMDPNNCGACNNTCTRPNSTASCVNSTCEFACAPGFIDLNNDASDGCEYACTVTSLTDLPDLAFTDANCDGIDGELSNGIFVSPSGVDSAAGTRAAPKQTIAAALTAATSENKRDIYIAHGTYTGPLNLTGIFSALNVAGGYHPTTWQRAQNLAAEINGGNPALNIDSSNNMLVQLLKFQSDNGNAGNPSSYGAKVSESMGIKLEGVELRSGNGLAGSDGTSRAAAANGNPGLQGLRGCYNDPRWDPFNNTLEWAACNSDQFHDFCSGGRVGAAGGTSTCSAPGGAGGASSRYNTPTTQPGQPGAAGQPMGGAAGSGVTAGAMPTPGGPNFGSAGTNGGGGADGAAASAGSFNASGFVLGAAAAGTAGTAGRGGGGGGGGAGGLGYVIPGYNGLQCYSYGSAGGGGGAGGCGGLGGAPGISGGASVALFLVNAQVTGQSVTLRPGNGGRGGNGGSGGSGGTGGAGGASDYHSRQAAATRGGGGGRGGDGGGGGHGGGGAGGPVYGVVKSASSTWTPNGGSVMLGTPGAGGTSPGNAGPTGASAIQLTY